MSRQDTTPAATVCPLTQEMLATARSLRHRTALKRTKQQRLKADRRTVLYLYLLSTTTLHHSVLATMKSCSSRALQVARCRRVKGLRGGLSHRDSHRWLSHSARSSSARRGRRGDAPSEGNGRRQLPPAELFYLTVVSYLTPPPPPPPAHRSSRCQPTATPQPGSRSCFLSAGLSPGRTEASTPETVLRKVKHLVSL